MPFPSHALLAPILIASLVSTSVTSRAYAQAEDGSLADRCLGVSIRNPTIESIAMARALKDDRRALVALGDLEGLVRPGALAAPDDADAQYALAVLLGARIEREGGRRRLAIATEMRALALRALALAPDHAGANYLMGRLHAAVKRMNRLARFFATHVLGGGALKGASWDASQSFLETAERTEPCEPEFHFELARVYGDRHQYEAAERECLHVLALTPDGDVRWDALREQAKRLRDQWKGRAR